MKILAMKILEKKHISLLKQIKNTIGERKILETNDCPFIIKLEYAFQTNDSLYFLTEFAQGGELFFHLDKEGCFSINRSKLYIAEIALALNALHQGNTIYRDLKPENILLSKSGHIKLSDFGLAKTELENNKAFSICGSPGYLSPDIFLEHGYDYRSDYFSLGLILYQMIEGQLAFPELKSLIPSSKNKNQILEIFQRGLNFSSKFPAEAIDLIEKLLKVNENERLSTIVKFKEHEFFSDLDWNLIETEGYNPEFIPQLTGDLDLRYFSLFFTSQNVDSKKIFDGGYDNSLSSQVNKEYENFTYINQSELKA